MKELLSCGLDRLIVAIDGATQESYAEYRKGGDLSLVVSNLERLISMKKGIDNSLQIELQFLEFPHNKNDRHTLRDLAIRLGVERFSVIEDCSTEGWEGKRFEGTEEERRQRGCYYLWTATTINSIGELGCCDYGEDHGMPNIGMATNYSSENLRNHPSLVTLRHSFKRNSTPLDAICKHCSQGIFK